MPQPLVTIPIAAYKTRPDHLTTAIKSALGQTWQNIEVIVSDDSPNPSLRAVVEQFLDPRLRYRHNFPGLGVARNHLLCFREAEGEYIAVLNHDDFFAPTFIERLVEPLIEHPALSLAFCDHWVVDADGQRLVPETEQTTKDWGRLALMEGIHRPFFDLLAAQTIPMAMGAVFRQSLLPSLLPAKAGPAYDLWLTYLLCQESYGAYYVRDRLSSWRSHPENITSRGGLDWSYGAAECWRTVANDARLASIRPIARRKAASAFCCCAVSSWRAGQRGRCFSFGWRSLRMSPTIKGFATLCLPVVPRAFPFKAFGSTRP
ncbi:MAG: glycosyltransferase [Aphanocapsa sp. GSE-SYN-MK-11-07L]|nr:glycosyltransferase [Aphanocapsa sp. GSE-SYN-MK-11-07L]